MFNLIMTTQKFYCQECFKLVEDTEDNRAPGIGLICECGNDAFYSEEEIEELLEWFPCLLKEDI